MIQNFKCYTPFIVIKYWPCSPCCTIYPCSFGCLLSLLCPALCDLRDCSPPGSSVHGVSQARILEWVAIPSCRGSCQHRDRTCLSCACCLACGYFTHWAIGERPWSYFIPNSLCTILILCLKKSKVWLITSNSLCLASDSVCKWID